MRHSVFGTFLLFSPIWSLTHAQESPGLPRLARDIHVFADSFFQHALASREIPGAIFVVVKDGKVLLSKGYGFADLEHQTPIDPERTAFRVASVSKLFTATAVMQQVERGRLKLDADVNSYLTTFKIANRFGKPVRVADLLTHSGGFDERQLGTIASSEATHVPLGKYLATHMPPEIRPPGEMVAYSNHGIALAGYLVEQVSGKPFVQYVQEEILVPLKMARSTFGRPIVPETERATGYVLMGDHFNPVHFERQWIQIPPAAGLATTGADMARFMIAMLDGGGYDPILKPSTLRLMRERHLANDPALPGATYGSFEHFENGLRGLMNDGDWVGFANRVFLVPEEHLGVYLTVNASNSRIRQRVISGLLDVVHPAPPPAPRPRKASVDLSRFAGRFRSIAMPHRTIDKLSELIQLVVNVEPDSTLRLSGLQYNGSPSARFYPIDSMVFAATEGEGVLVFRGDKNGRITHLFLGNTDQEITGSTVMERLPGYAALKPQVALLAFLIACPLTVIWWPAGNLIRRLRGRPRSEPKPARWARFVAGMVSLMILLFLAVLITPVVNSMITNDYAGGDVTAGMKAFFLLPMLTVVVGLAMPYFATIAWKRQYWSFLGRVHYSLLTVAALLYIPFLIHWNMLGFNF